MSNPKTPSLNSAIDFLRMLVSRSDIKQLPPVRHIAAQCGVSAVTAGRAVKLLQKEGVIVSRWGQGNFIAAHAPIKKNLILTPDAGYESKVQLIVNSLKKDLSTGLYPPNKPLPQIKHLVTIYNASYPTIRKILQQLITESILVRNGNKFYFNIQRSSKRPRVAVIAFGLSYNAVKIVTERERNFYRQLSIAVAGHNIDLEIICYNDYLDKPEFFVPDNHTIQSYLQKDEFCGIILSSYHMNNSAECLRQIAQIKKPVSVWIEDHSVLESVKRYSTRNNITFFDASYSTQPGQEIGRFLLEKGHHTIAYISPFHASSWSINRLLGLKQVFKSIDNSAHVHEFVLTEFNNDYSFMKKILVKNSFAEIFSDNRFNNMLHPLLRTKTDALELEFNTLLRDNLIFTYCEPLFEQVSAVPEITAWVATNDLIACMIHDYWGFNGIPENKRPALIGFDNTFKSLEKEISSYDFNTSGDVNNMILHLLYPSSSLFSSKQRVIRLKGTVIQRKSTRM